MFYNFTAQMKGKPTLLFLGRTITFYKETQDTLEFPKCNVLVTATVVFICMYYTHISLYYYVIERRHNTATFPKNERIYRFIFRAFYCEAK